MKKENYSSNTKSTQLTTLTKSAGGSDNRSSTSKSTAITNITPPSKTPNGGTNNSGKQ